MPQPERLNQQSPGILRVTLVLLSGRQNPIKVWPRPDSSELVLEGNGMCGVAFHHWKIRRYSRVALK